MRNLSPGVAMTLVICIFSARASADDFSIGDYAPLPSGGGQSFLWQDLSVPASVGHSAHLVVEAQGDFNGSDEFLAWDIDGLASGKACDLGCVFTSLGGTNEYFEETFLITAPVMELITSDGLVTVSLEASPPADSHEPGSFVAFTLSYVAECADGFDNDCDGLADLDDPDCADTDDHSEADSALPGESTAKCGDGADNDCDGLVDLADPGCSDTDDDSETDLALPCDDGVDNEGDGGFDFDPVTAGDAPDFAAGRGDPGCADPASLLESPKCQDGLSNDADGLIDFDGGFSAGLPPEQTTLPDPQCEGKPFANREKVSPKRRCGIGFEPALLLPALMWLAIRRRRQEGRRAGSVAECSGRP